jgi:hypothetical protein
LEITAIAKQYDKDGDEKSDLMTWSASLTHLGELSVSCVRDMANQVIRAAGHRKITKLNLIDHGTPGATYIRIGKDKITTGNIEKFRSPLERLSEKFDRNGIVHVQNCYAGRNVGLLKQFAKILLVPVYAGTDLQAPWCRYQFGEYVVAYPKGNPKTDVSVPSDPKGTDHLRD